MPDPEKPPPYSMYEWLRSHDTRLSAHPLIETSSELSGILCAIVAGIHPDEWEIRDIVRDNTKFQQFPSFLMPHPLAEFFQSRVYIEPLTSEYLTALSFRDLRKITIVRNGRNLDHYAGEIPDAILRFHLEIKRVVGLGEKNEHTQTAFAQLKQNLIIFFEIKSTSPYGHEFHLGRKVDLNRECSVPSTAKTWDDVLRPTTRDEVRDLYVFLKNNPELRALFLFHEDLEFTGHDPIDVNIGRQGGFYFYDTFGNVADDRDKDLVAELKEKLLSEVHSAGFTLMNGSDDPDDPDLNNSVDQGYIAAEVQNDAGEFVDENSFEVAAVKLGRLGITKVRRAFVFEIPGKATLEEKKILYDIITRVFMEPFLARTHSAEEVHAV